MNKKLLAVAVAGAFAASGAAFANGHHGSDHGPGAKVNGHVFSTFNLTDDFAGEDADGNLNERKFHTDAEINFKAMVADGVYARVDLDYGLASGTDGIEQAYGAWKINDMVKLQIGRFNNPLGIEAHDQADLTTISHGLIREFVLNDQVTGGSDGNNLDGVAVHLNAGPAKITVGVLNDIGGVSEENSLLLNLSASPVDGLDLNLGVLTQENDTTEFGNLINFNAAYGMQLNDDMSLKVSLDFITASEILDTGFSLAGHLGFAQGFGVTLRYDMLEDDASNELTAITLAGSYKVADNFDLRLEWRNLDDDVDDGDQVNLAAAFKF